jgi:hypothetical protein
MFEVVCARTRSPDGASGYEGGGAASRRAASTMNARRRARSGGSCWLVPVLDPEANNHGQKPENVDDDDDDGLC